MKKLILTLSILILACNAQAITLYNTVYNNFELINLSNKASLVGNYLQLDNPTGTYLIATDSTEIDAYTSYKYYIRFANLHNKEGKSYKVRDTQGNTKSIASTECGIVFNYTTRGYWMVSVSCSNSSLYNESVDTRSMTVSLSRIDNGKKSIIQTITLGKDVNLDESYNYLGVNVDDNEIAIKIGKDELNEVMTHNFTDQEREASFGVPSNKVGYFVGPGAKISIERTVLSFDNENNSKAINLETQWTREALDRHFAASKNPYEGYWTYLDRDMEDKWLKLGGRYTIALVETEKGYDVIYVEGAQVKKSQWHLGMKKGEMTKTIFTDNFTGLWHDATQEAIDQDVYVTFESGVILCFKFPVYKSQIRFSKVLQ